MSTRKESGNVLTELVIVIPLFVLMIGFVFEVGRMYYIQNTLEYGAKEAARIGASIKESVDENFASKKTLSRGEIEELIVNSVRVSMVIEEREQFMVRYLNPAGNEVQGIMDLPFDRQNNPDSVDFIEVEITYPGVGANVNSPIPVIFNPGGILQNKLTLMARSIFKVEGRFEDR